MDRRAMDRRPPLALALLLSACAASPPEPPAGTAQAPVAPASGQARTGRRGAQAPDRPPPAQARRPGPDGAIDEAADALAQRLGRLDWPAHAARDAAGRPLVIMGRIQNRTRGFVDTHVLGDRVMARLADVVTRGEGAPAALVLLGAIREDVSHGPAGAARTWSATLRLVDAPRGLLLAQGRAQAGSTAAPGDAPVDVARLAEEAAAEHARQVAALAAAGWPQHLTLTSPRPAARLDRAVNRTQEPLDVAWMMDVAAQAILDQGAVDLAAGADDAAAAREATGEEGDHLFAPLIIRAELERAGRGHAVKLHLVDTTRGEALVSVEAPRR
ncbi:MAG: hypothetical protein M9894_13285 [Planctomycetes bacterium]|nr:hypothetical protein [Planctomycetota bacterium]